MKLVLQVWHKDSYRMVGKTFSVGGVQVFLHEESGSQGHQNLSAPGGIDLIIIPFLGEAGVEIIHHYNRKTKILYSSGRHNFLLHATKQTSGGRKRAYLAERYWNKDYMQSTLPFKVPWISDVKQFGGPLEGVQLGLPGMEGS
jgi:hypothetical protein